MNRWTNFKNNVGEVSSGAPGVVATMLVSILTLVGVLLAIRLIVLAFQLTPLFGWFLLVVVVVSACVIASRETP